MPAKVCPLGFASSQLWVMSSLEIALLFYSHFSSLSQVSNFYQCISNSPTSSQLCVPQGINLPLLSPPLPLVPCLLLLLGLLQPLLGLPFLLSFRSFNEKLQRLMPLGCLIPDLIPAGLLQSCCSLAAPSRLSELAVG